MVDSIIFRNTDSDFPKLLFDDKAKVVDLFLSNNNGEVDALLSTTLEKHLKQDAYINILVPVSIGRTLSDFLGLRFATHIRTTPHKNQLSNIFIYSYTGLSDLMGNECFDILNVKGVHLINFSLSGFNSAIGKRNIFIAENQLPIEISKLKLDVPDNYLDNHSVANLWAMHRWSTMMGDLSDSDDELQKIKTKVYTSIYFKYLKTLHRTNQLEPLDLNQFKIRNKGSLLLIDDEANKGWYEIFCTLLVDNNDGIELDYIDDDKFHGKSQKEIIRICINEIKQIKDYPDVIILDLRLHPLDFETKSVSALTGFKILKKIKKINPGIQVIIFSASNKIWNLQALQQAGADGFIMKDSPETTLIDDFTLQSLKNMLHTIDLSLKRNFLKDFYFRLEELREELIPRKNFKITPRPLPKEFVDETLKWLALSCDVLARDIREVNITSSFLFMFSVLENLGNWVIDADNPKEVTSSNDGSQKKFEFEFRKNSQKLKYFKENQDLGRYEITNFNLQSNRSLPWTAKILNTLYFINNGELPEIILSDIIRKRNDIVHANATTGNVIEISKEMLVTLNEILFKGLKGV